MNEQDFLKSLEDRLTKERDGRVLGQLMVRLLDMADDAQAASQRTGSRRLFFCLRIWLLQLQVCLKDWLSGQWQQYIRAARRQMIGTWRKVQHYAHHLQQDPAEIVRQSRDYTTEDRSLVHELVVGFRRLRRQLVLLEGPAVVLMILAVVASQLVQTGIAGRTRIDPITKARLILLNNASVALADIATFLGVIAVPIMLPHIVRLIRVFKMTMPDWTLDKLTFDK